MGYCFSYTINTLTALTRLQRSFTMKKKKAGTCARLYFLIKKLFGYDFAVSHFVHHELMDLYPAQTINGNVNLPSYNKMIGSYQWLRCVSFVGGSNSLYPVFTFFTNECLAFSIGK